MHYVARATSAALCKIPSTLIAFGIALRLSALEVAGGEAPSPGSLPLSASRSFGGTLPNLRPAG